MNIVQAIKYLYPNADSLKDFTVQDDSDGKGAYLSQWNLKDVDNIDIPQPTDAELQAAWDSMQPTDADLLSLAISKKNQEISNAVGAKIIGGYKSTVVLTSTSKAHLYGSQIPDQVNISAEYSGMIANPTQTTVSFRPQDVDDFVDHTRDEFKQIAEAYKAYIKDLLQTGYNLKKQVSVLTTVADVNNFKVII